MSPEVEKKIIACVRKNADVFAFQPSDLKGVDPKIAMHVLHEDPSDKLVKQKLRKFGAEKDEIIKQEVEKLLKAGHVIEL